MDHLNYHVVLILISTKDIAQGPKNYLTYTQKKLASNLCKGQLPECCIVPNTYYMYIQMFHSICFFLQYSYTEDD